LNIYRSFTPKSSTGGKCSVAWRLFVFIFSAGLGDPAQRGISIGPSGIHGR